MNFKFPNILFPILSTFLFTVFTGCINGQTTDGDNKSNIKKIATLPTVIKESSGLAMADGEHFWTQNDQGNKPNLYEIDKSGQLVQTIKFDQITNVDWEDLTEDDKGYLYVGDFGNGKNDRENLVIYKMLKADLKENKKNIPVEKITYQYDNQRDFPPVKTYRPFDVEAMFYKDEFIYLLTKDQSIPARDSSRLYRLPSVPGNYQAKYISEFRTKNNKNKGQITAAALSPSGNILAVTSNEEIWIFRGFKGADFFSGKEERMDLKKGWQIEAVVFADECTLYLTCEANKNSRASLFEIVICK